MNEVKERRAGNYVKYQLLIDLDEMLPFFKVASFHITQRFYQLNGAIHAVHIIGVF